MLLSFSGEIDPPMVRFAFPWGKIQIQCLTGKLIQVFNIFVSFHF